MPGLLKRLSLRLNGTPLLQPQTDGLGRDENGVHTDNQPG